MLFNVLSKEDRETFRITGFSSAIPFIRTFFRWWESFKEEDISTELDWSLLITSTLPTDTITWQENVYK